MKVELDCKEINRLADEFEATDRPPSDADGELVQAGLLPAKCRAIPEGIPMCWARAARRN